MQWMSKLPKDICDLLIKNPQSLHLGKHHCEILNWRRKQTSLWYWPCLLSGVILS